MRGTQVAFLLDQRFIDHIFTFWQILKQTHFALAHNILFP